MSCTWLCYCVIWAIFQLSHGENKLHSMRSWWYLLCTRPIHFSWIIIVLAEWNNSPQVDTSPHTLGHINLSFPSQSVFALSPQCCMHNGETTNTTFIVFDLTWPGFEPTIYHNRGDYINHYNTDAVLWYWDITSMKWICTWSNRARSIYLFGLVTVTCSSFGVPFIWPFKLTSH